MNIINATAENISVQNELDREITPERLAVIQRARPSWAVNCTVSDRDYLGDNVVWSGEVTSGVASGTQIVRWDSLLFDGNAWELGPLEIDVWSSERGDFSFSSTTEARELAALLLKTADAHDRICGTI